MGNATETSSQRPYLLRAMHEWMADNGLTPHLVVDANAEGLRAPPGHANDGKLILNISYSATQSLSLGNEWVSFEARFNGAPHHVSVPISAVLGIYARETGQGMAFAGEEPEPPGPGGGRDSASRTPAKSAQPARRSQDRPTLKVVK
jgi:stringent starvation protein B